MPNGDAPRPAIVGVGFWFEFGLGMLALAAGWISGMPFWRHMYWNGVHLLLGLAAVTPMLLLFFACLLVPLGPLRRIRKVTDEFIRPLFEGCTISDLALLSGAAGLGEELLFRGYLQGLSVGLFGNWPGLVAASCLFGVMHLITPTYAVFATLVGAYLGVCYALTENLFTVVVAHALYDFVALVYLVRSPQRSEDAAAPLE